LVLGGTAVGYFGSASLTLAIARTQPFVSPLWSLVVGTILGSVLGSMVLRRQPNSGASPLAKSVLSLILAICTLTFGLIFEPADDWKAVLLAVIGSIAWPFVSFDGIWRALARIAP
jgi:hypothetical protein